MMQNKKDLQRNLLGSLLDDDEDTQHSSSKKSTENHKKLQAFSAPPVFFDFDLKMNFQLLDEYNFDCPDPEDQKIVKAFCNKEKKYNNEHLDSMPNGFRKMSCDSALMSYYDNVQTSDFDYYQYNNALVTPEQELLSNSHKAVQWARDQNGSRAVQNVFDSDNVKDKDIIFNNLTKESKMLMKDRFGNYVFQKIFEKGSIEHKQILLYSIWGQIIQLSVHPYGCRVIQKAIQFIADRKQKQFQFIQQIFNDGLTLMQNPNGNHVIQKCIQVFPHQVIQPLADIIVAKIKGLAYDAYGCRVVQKYLQNHRGHQKCEYVLKQLLKQAVPLSQCQFGNYVMQYIVTKCQNQRKQVFKQFLQRIVELSVNKFASNVVEKAIQAPKSQFCNMLTDWFIDHHKQVVQLAKHQYGNYVIQSIFQKTSHDKKAAIKCILKQNGTEISKSQHGRHVLMQLQKNFRNK